jgi:hypothetical protein
LLNPVPIMIVSNRSSLNRFAAPNKHPHDTDPEDKKSISHFWRFSYSNRRRWVSTDSYGSVPLRKNGYGQMSFPINRSRSEATLPGSFLPELKWMIPGIGTVPAPLVFVSSGVGQRFTAFVRFFLQGDAPFTSGMLLA